MKRGLGGGAHQSLWTPASLPSVIPITRLPADLTDPNQRVDGLSLDPVIAEEGPERLIERRGNLFRLHIVETPEGQIPCAVLPLDRLFAIRASVALRLWRGLTGRSPGRDPAALPATRRDRLARLGYAMMQGGYRRLLLYPFRGRT